MKITENCSRSSHLVNTIAIYGVNPPELIHGHLILRTYYSDGRKSQVDTVKTADYIKNEVFYETNKIIRERMHDRYDEQLNLAAISLPGFEGSYLLIYNKTANPANTAEDNRLEILENDDPDARGLAIIMKKDEKTGITWLNDQETAELMEKFSQH